MINRKATEGRLTEAPRRARLRPLTDQRGSMLVEAVVSAALLMILSMGFLASLDTAAQSSGNVKSRSVAASLARDDMERMRALKVSDLANLNATRTQIVDGVPYTIHSSTRWVDDVTGGATCGSAATKTDYLKTVSSVTFPVMGTTAPVTNESLVAVPNGAIGGSSGGLIAKVLDGAGAPVSGVGVTITGPSVNTGTTDAGGCAMWSAATVGGYYVDIAKSGYVDRSGAATIRRTATVPRGATSSVAFEYDRAGAVNVSFDTQVGASTQTAQARDISYLHSGMPQGMVTVSSASSATSISTGTKLFPFADPYAVWGGACAGADPRAYGEATPLVTVAPGGSLNVTARLPALNLRVLRGGSPLSTAKVRITPVTAGCGTTFGATGLLNANGELIQPGMAYGDYTVCVDDGSRRATSATIQNRSAAGTALVTLAIPTGGGGSTCS